MQVAVLDRPLDWQVLLAGVVPLKCGSVSPGTQFISSFNESVSSVERRLTCLESVAYRVCSLGPLWTQGVVIDATPLLGLHATWMRRTRNGAVPVCDGSTGEKDYRASHGRQSQVVRVQVEWSIPNKRSTSSAIFQQLLACLLSIIVNWWLPSLCGGA